MQWALSWLSNRARRSSRWPCLQLYVLVKSHKDYIISFHLIDKVLNLIYLYAIFLFYFFFFAFYIVISDRNGYKTLSTLTYIFVFIWYGKKIMIKMNNKCWLYCAMSFYLKNERWNEIIKLQIDKKFFNLTLFYYIFFVSTIYISITGQSTWHKIVDKAINCAQLYIRKSFFIGIAA